jgi:hypothetical protein
LNQEIIRSPKGDITLYSNFESPVSNVSDFLDLIGNARSETIALKKEDLKDTFYDLKTRLAGDLLQKLSNYNKRLIIIGDFQNIGHKSLKDFIYESNKTGKVVFVGSLEEGIQKLQ